MSLVYVKQIKQQLSALNESASKGKGNTDVLVSFVETLEELLTLEDPEDRYLNLTISSLLSFLCGHQMLSFYYIEQIISFIEPLLNRLKSDSLIQSHVFTIIGLTGMYVLYISFVQGY